MRNPDECLRIAGTARLSSGGEDIDAEPQFESYRELGFLAGQAVCRITDLGDAIAKWFPAQGEDYRKDETPTERTRVASNQKVETNRNFTEPE